MFCELFFKLHPLIKQIVSFYLAEQNNVYVKPFSRDTPLTDKSFIRILYRTYVYTKLAKISNIVIASSLKQKTENIILSIFSVFVKLIII